MTLLVMTTHRWFRVSWDMAFWQNSRNLDVGELAKASIQHLCTTSMLSVKSNSTLRFANAPNANGQISELVVRIKFT